MPEYNVAYMMSGLGVNICKYKAHITNKQTIIPMYVPKSHVDIKHQTIQYYM